jgi:hypothetical protein
VKIEQTDTGTLVITNRETFIRVLLIGCAMVIVFVWLAPVPRREAIGWSAICFLFGLALIAADERSRFVFDRGRGVLTWRTDNVFRHAEGEIALSTITALSLEHSFTSSGGRSNAKRLVVLTSKGPLPVTRSYSGIDRTQQPVGRAIQQFLSEFSPAASIPFITD